MKVANTKARNAPSSQSAPWSASSTHPTRPTTSTNAFDSVNSTSSATVAPDFLARSTGCDMTVLSRQWRTTFSLSDKDYESAVPAGGGGSFRFRAARSTSARSAAVTRRVSAARRATAKRMFCNRPTCGAE